MVSISPLLMPLYFLIYDCAEVTIALTMFLSRSLLFFVDPWLMILPASSGVMLEGRFAMRDSLNSCMRGSASNASRSCSFIFVGSSVFLYNTCFRLYNHWTLLLRTYINILFFLYFAGDEPVTSHPWRLSNA